MLLCSFLRFFSKFLLEFLSILSSLLSKFIFAASCHGDLRIKHSIAVLTDLNQIRKEAAAIFLFATVQASGSHSTRLMSHQSLSFTLGDLNGEGGMLRLGSGKA